jgi:multiple sugar transport system substrate-binding protein
MARLTSVSRQYKSRNTLIVAVLFLLLTACQSPPAESISQDIPSPATPVMITVWHTQNGAASLLLGQLLSDFRKAYPAITVRAEQKANEGDLLRQGLAGIALNQVPDALIADNRTIGEFARRGALMSLDTFIDSPALGLSAEERTDFFPGLLEAGRLPDLKDRTYAYPFSNHAAVMVYNVDLLKSAKADTPPRTWDQFNAAVRATTKGNVRGWVMFPNALTFYAFLFSRGGNVLTARDTQVLAQFGDDDGLKSLQLIATLTRSGAAYLVDNAASARDDFVQNKTALLFCGSDELSLIADGVTRTGSSIHWSVTNLPQDDSTHPATAIFGSDIAIFRTTNERSRAAWLLARWLTQPAQSARWSRVTMALPLRASALSQMAANPPPVLQQLRDGYGDVLPVGRPAPSVNNAGQIDSVIAQMWFQVASGADPSAELKIAVQRVNRLLGQMP